MLIVIEVQRTALSPVQYPASLEGCTLEDMGWGKEASYPEQCTMLRIDVVGIIIH